MNALAIDCAVSRLTISAKKDEKIVAVILDIGMKQSESLVPTIDYVLEKIELLISDYNVKKNKVEEDNVRFVALYESVNSMLERLEA